MAALLSLLPLLFSIAVAEPFVYNCSSESSSAINSYFPSEKRFALRLTTGGSIRSCSAQFINIRLASAYFYIRVNGSLSWPNSLLSLSSSGSTSEPLASLTKSNQTVYQAFATPGASLYAKLSSSSSESILLDIETVHGCPSWWVSYGKECYGSVLPGVVSRSFENAAAACKMVRANLALSFASPAVLGFAVRNSGWSNSEPVWIGAADTSSGLYFLDGSKFSVSSSSRLTFSGSSASKYSCETGSCRCVYYRAGSYYRQYCSQYMRYLCSNRIGGDELYYSLDTLDALLDSQTTFVYPYWAISLIIGFICLVVVVSTRLVFYHRAVMAQRSRSAAAINAAARSGPAPPPGSYPVQPPPSAYQNLAFYHPAAGGLEQPLPPAYQARPEQQQQPQQLPLALVGATGQNEDDDEKPPPYDFATAPLTSQQQQQQQ